MSTPFDTPVLRRGRDVLNPVEIYHGKILPKVPVSFPYFYDAPDRVDSLIETDGFGELRQDVGGFISGIGSGQPSAGHLTLE